MPRPKRTKVNSALNARPTLASSPVAESHTQVADYADRRAEKEEVPVPDEDDSDGLVYMSNRRRNYGYRLQPPREEGVEFTMSGGLPAGTRPEDAVSIEPTRTVSTISDIESVGVMSKKQARTLAKQANGKGKAKAVSTATPRPQLKIVSRLQQEEATPPENVSSKPVKGVNTANGRNDSLLDSTDYSLTSINSETPQSQRPPQSVLKHGTPGIETSILGLTNFKRRARQPSFLRMINQVTDLEDNDDSTLGEVSFGDLDVTDFNPDAESTPLQLSKKRAAEDKQGEEDANETILSTSSSASKRRKLSDSRDTDETEQAQETEAGQDGNTDALVGDHQEQVAEPNPEDESNLANSSAPRIEVISPTRSARSESPALPGPAAESEVEESGQGAPVTNTEGGQAEPMSDTMAPPRSSSPIDEANEHDGPVVQTVEPVQLKGRGRPRKKTKTNATAEPRSTRASKKAEKAVEMSTAQLQRLLPKRQSVPRDWEDEKDKGDRGIYDFPSSDLESVAENSDEDELSRPPKRRAPLRKASTTAKTNKKGGIEKKSAQKGKKANVAKKTKDKAIAASGEQDKEKSKSSSSSAPRTYGRAQRTSSDKENQNDGNTTAGDVNDDDSSSFNAEGTPVDTRADSGAVLKIDPRELEKIQKKFQAVDEFELDFEDAVDGDSSSPLR